jgi:NAD(P) transhydrogenase subunit alpha
MRIAVPKEITPGEKRVVFTPDSVTRLVKSGFEVVVEKGAGVSAIYPDSDYVNAGATIEDNVEALLGGADLVIKVQGPAKNDATGKHEIDMMREGSALIALIYPLTNHDTVKRLAKRRITAFSVKAAGRLPKFFPMFMTAAGTVAPAKVLVIGAGVAGLQACATAKRLGAVVEAFDQRPVVKEQVESLGVKFVEVPTEEEAEGAGGYAKELSEEYKKKQAELIRKHILKSDVVITTALIPGKRAPILITGDMVKEMRQGSVIVDLAADFGGNCEFTEPGRDVEKHGVPKLTWPLPWQYMRARCSRRTWRSSSCISRKRTAQS